MTSKVRQFTIFQIFGLDNATFCKIKGIGQSILGLFVPGWPVFFSTRHTYPINPVL